MLGYGFQQCQSTERSSKHIRKENPINVKVRYFAWTFNHRSMDNFPNGIRQAGSMPGDKLLLSCLPTELTPIRSER